VDQSLADEVLAAKSNMLDQMGIYQHHDAVSGTAKQHVADDYSIRLGEAMAQNNRAYGKAMDVEMLKLSGMSSNATWQLCDRTNGTYLDCPISTYNLSQGSEVYLSIHNPSVVLATVAKVAVPDGHFSVDWYGYGMWNRMETGTDVLCNKDRAADQSPMTSCQLFLNTDALFPGSIALYRLTYNTSSDLEVKAVPATEGDFIESPEFLLRLGATVAKESNVNFSLFDKRHNTTEALDFGLRYWPSYVKYGQESSNSGAYAFRQIDNLYYPLPYSTFKEAWVAKGDMVSKFTLYFERANRKTGEAEMEAIVHITIDLDLNILKFDVDLNSIPTPYLDGYEVVAMFHAHNFDNNGTFFTDSNGLDMQERVLNYRSYYNITDKVYSLINSNITANFYPINSAVALRDGQRQFTVMNDRAQSGSALNPGSIELMQNRRIPTDDNKGVGEFLNETDQWGNGIRVPATYFVQLGNLTTRPSMQRLA
jgi:hypothetical protein